MSGRKGEARILHLSEMNSSDVDIIQVRHVDANSFTTLRGLGEKDIDAFLNALSSVDSANFVRLPSPNEEILLRIKTKNETFDLDFSLNESRSDWVYFSLVQRTYRGNNGSWTQDNFGKFRVKGIRDFLRTAANAS
tara:strand:+ start:1698 stop:2105 length:408 start_codon:yes stop_codon:yes gene_type:complete